MVSMGGDGRSYRLGSRLSSSAGSVAELRARSSSQGNALNLHEIQSRLSRGSSNPLDAAGGGGGCRLSTSSRASRLSMSSIGRLSMSSITSTADDGGSEASSGLCPYPSRRGSQSERRSSVLKLYPSRGSQSSTWSEARGSTNKTPRKLGQVEVLAALEEKGITAGSDDASEDPGKNIEKKLRAELGKKWRKEKRKMKKQARMAEIKALQESKRRGSMTAEHPANLLLLQKAEACRLMKKAKKKEKKKRAVAKSAQMSAQMQAQGCAQHSRW